MDNIKKISIVLVLALGLEFVMIATSFVGVSVYHRINDGPRWSCQAEDEVVVIDDTCRHVDDITGISAPVENFPHLTGELQNTYDPQPSGVYDQTEPATLR